MVLVFFNCSTCLGLAQDVLDKALCILFWVHLVKVWSPEFFCWFCLDNLSDIENGIWKSLTIVVFLLLVLLFWDRIPLQPLLAWNSWSSCLCVLGAGQACATSPSSQPLLCLNPSTSCKSLAFAPYAEVSRWCGVATASSWQTDPFDFCGLSAILHFKSLCLIMSLHHYSVSLFVDYLLSFHLVCTCR